MKGGLNQRDYDKVKDNRPLRFTNSELVDYFRDYHFGTRGRTQKWLGILNVAKENNIPVFILTAGDRQGIIRTLQLMDLDEYIVIRSGKIGKLEKD